MKVGVRGGAVDVIEEPLGPVTGLWKAGLYFGAMMAVTQGGMRMLGSGPIDWVEVGIAAGVAAIVSGPLFAWLMGRQYRPASVEVDVGDRSAFEAKVAKGRGLWRPRVTATADGFRADGSNWLVGLPAVIVRYDGGSARLYGPQAIVKWMVGRAKAAPSDGSP